MERVIDELEMISSPLAESEDSLISEMSMRNDIARSSWLELRGIRRRLEDGNESDFEDEEIYAPPVPERDYSRLRPHVYRKRGEEFPMKRSKSYERPVRPRTPERKWRRHLKDKTKLVNPVYATPIRKISKEAAIIEEFTEDVVPRYAKTNGIEKKLEDVPPVIDISTEVEFSSSKKRKEAKLAREDSLTSLLKKQLSKKEKKEKLPEYVEPKDPIIKELQEFLKIEPKSSEESGSSAKEIQDEVIVENEEKLETPVKEKAVEADEHRLIIRGWEKLMKTSSSSSASSNSSSTTV